MHLVFELPRDRCPICDGSPVTPAYQISAFGAQVGYSICNACGFIFQNPRLTAESVRSAYVADDYWNTAYHEYFKGDRLRMANSRRRVRFMEQAVGVKAKGKLLDIGSATGIFAVAARDAGYSVRCIEPSEEIAKIGRDAYGLDFTVSTWEDAEVEPGSYDAVTLWGTDSHFLDPLPAFRKIAAALRPGGVFAMNYQDFDHPIRKIFPDLKTGWNVMFNLTGRSIDKIMQLCGLEIVAARMEWPLVSMGAVLRAVRRPSFPLAERIVLPVPSVSYRAIAAVKIADRHTD